MKNLVEDAAAIYSSSSPFKAVLYNTLPEAQNDYIYMNLSRKGVQKVNIKVLADYMGLTQELISSFIHSSFRNIQRKSDSELLDISKSERLLELASFAKKATQVLGSVEAMKIWIQTALPALEYKKPIDFLDTSFGLNILKDVLGRIQYGIYS